MCIKQILSESDYDLIITKSLKSRDRKKLEEYLENLFKHNIEHNRKFWVYLSDALRDNNQLSDEEYGSIIDVSYLEREWRIDQLTTPFERHLFLYNYINLRIEDLLIERKIKGHEFNIDKLPKAIVEISKINQRSPLSRKIMKDSIKTYGNWIEQGVYNSMFITKHIDGVKDKEALKLFVRIYFCEKLIIKSKNEEEGLTYIDSNEQLYLYKYRQEIDKKTAIKVFKRGLDNFHSKSFHNFLTFEKLRWKAVLDKIGESENEYHLLSKYINLIGRITHKEVSDNLYNFGIKKERRNELLNLIKDIQKHIPLLSDGIYPEKLADVLTTEDYRKENPINFSIETTTLAYVISRIAIKYGVEKKLNGSSIEQSKLFNIPKLAKPSDADIIPEYVTLRRQNYENSLRRFTEYAENEDRPEYRHANILSSILKKHKF